MKSKLLALLVLICSRGFSQKTIKTLIKDENNRPVANASISVYHLNDTIPVLRSAANLQGLAEFTQPEDGTYFIKVSSTGFMEKKSLNFTIGSHRAPFDTLYIKLTGSINLLNNITLTAHKPLVENHIDRLVVNVDAMLNTSGNTLLEVLGNSPGMDVDINGTINMRGKSGVLVLIDGKQNYLSGADLTNYLNSVPASQVDQIEIMTQPSAKYDAAGNSGVINIKMKKNRQMGFNGNLSSSFAQGAYSRTLNSMLMNYRFGKWNFFASADANYIKRFTHRNLSRYIQNPAALLPNIQYYQDENDIAITPDHSIAGAIDYSVDKRSSLSFSFNEKVSGQRNVVTDHSSFNDLDRNGKMLSTVDDINVFNNPWNNTELAIGYTNSSGKKNTLSLDLTYDLYHFNSAQHSYTTSVDSLGNLQAGLLNPYVQKAVLPSDIQLISGRADESHSFKNSKLDMGVKASLISSKNQSLFYYMEGNNYKLDTGLTNFYNYKETITAGYMNYHRQWKKWELQGGLRLEFTHSSGQQSVTGVSFVKNYVQLFPTVFVSYSPDKNNAFGLSYGRRIDRPGYTDLNPFLYLLDPYSYRKGNPDLRPYFTSNLEASYNYKGKLNLSLDYSNTSDIIDFVYDQNDSTKVLLQTKANLNQLVSFALNLNYSAHIKNWSTVLFSYSIFNDHYTGNNGKQTIDHNMTTQLINYTQQFRFRKTWTAEMNVVYRTHFLMGAATVRFARKITGVAIGKDLLKGKANLKLKVTDPFLIQRSGGYTMTGNVYTTTQFREDSRRLGLSFVYRFQKGLKTVQHKQYTPEEKNRVITGG